MSLVKQRIILFLSFYVMVFAFVAYGDSDNLFEFHHAEVDNIIKD